MCDNLQLLALIEIFKGFPIKIEEWCNKDTIGNLKNPKKLIFADKILFIYKKTLESVVTLKDMQVNDPKFLSSKFVVSLACINFTIFFYLTA